MSKGRAWRRHVLVVGVAALSVMATASVGAAVGPGGAAAEVQSVLDTQVAAVVAGDEGAYMGTIDPAASEEFRQAQRHRFGGLRSVPVVDHTLRVRPEQSGDLAPGLGLAPGYGLEAGEVFLPLTERRYRLDGYDDRPVVDQLWWTFVRRSGRWYVAAEDDADLVGVRSSRTLWDGGPVEIAGAGSPVLVLASSGGSARANALVATAGEAIAEFERQWQSPWSGRVPVVVPPSAEAAAALLGTSTDVADFSAFVTYVPLREEGWATTAPRMFVQDDNLARNTERRQRETIVHELVHAASADRSGPFTPVWLHEGLADWVRLGRPLDLQPPVGSELRLPPSDRFTNGNAADLREAYDLSAAAVSFLARRWGLEAPLGLFDAIGARRVSPGSPAYNVDQAMREVTGLGVAEFEREWQAASVL